MRKYTETPWGPSSETETTVIADGIISYTTPSHGGFHLSEARQKVIQKRFPDFKTFGNGTAWFEEDCDAAVVMVAFPEAFSETNVKHAEKMILNMPDYFKITAYQLFNEKSQARNTESIA